MNIRVGFLNIYEGCNFQQPEHPYIPSAYIKVLSNNDFDILCLAECPIDTESGSSKFVQNLSEHLKLSYFKCLASGKGFIGQTQFSGLAILSRYSLMNYRIKKFVNPLLTSRRPDGEIWKSHDKYIQLAELEISTTKINLVNTHLLPLPHFGHTLADSVGKKIFTTFTETIDRLSGPTIITGDFNNKNSTPLSSLLKREERFAYPTESVVAAVVKPGENHGSNIVVSTEFQITECWSSINYSDAYLLGVELHVDTQS